MPAQRIFVKIEKRFRLLTPNINLQGINLSGITRKAITDSDILSNFIFNGSRCKYRIRQSNKKGCFLQHCETLC